MSVILVSSYVIVEDFCWDYFRSCAILDFNYTICLFYDYEGA